MTNADKFKHLFGIYATELWAMPEKDFLKWLNSEVVNCSEIPNNSDTISRQAALEAFGLSEKTRKYGGDHSGYDTRMLYEIQDVLEDLPSAQPATNCSEFPNNSDTISREAVADAINGIECTRHTTWYEFYQKVMTAVEKLPSAEPKRGKWIYGEDSMADGVDGYRCDHCGFFIPWDYTHKSIDYIKGYNYCPNCGAKMEATE